MLSYLHAHLVFVPKYRRRMFDADALEQVRNAFRVVCADFGADLVAFTGAPDHVHLLVHYPPKVSLSHLVNSLKGVSSRTLQQARPDIARRYWRGGL